MKSHILRYGTNAEQKIISKAKDAFDVLAINGNMMAHSPKAISAFLVNLILDSGMKKRYFIDPITHSFQHDLKHITGSKGEIKSSIASLIEAYGEPIQNAVIARNESIRPQDFNESNIKSFCKQVIDYQLTVVSQNASEKGYSEYLEYVNPEYLNQFEPDFVIPPYFYINDLDWIDINLKFLKVAKELYPNKKIFAQLVMPKQFLSQTVATIILKKYAEIVVPGILLWIDELDEIECDKEILVNFIQFLARLKEVTKSEIYNLYGSFFSNILMSKGTNLLAGVGHGLEYGEHRAVVPVGGGIPTNKYYYYDSHCRLDYKLMSEILFEFGYSAMNSGEGANRYYKEICNCKACHSAIGNDINNFKKFENTLFYSINMKGTIQRRSYADQDTKELCVLHYMLNKKREFDYIKKSDIHQILADLQAASDNLMKLPLRLHRSFVHIDNWRSIFE